MYQMEKITTGVSYTTSAVGTGYWFLQLLDRVSPSQWAAIGVLGSLLFGLLTYTKELADANATIESLRADVSAGRKRLQVAATCAKSTTGASGMGNGESPRLTADAELNYYRLRSGIDKITAQVNYLQEYIRTQCLK